ncbi:MAG: glucokinase [Pseudomonadota bacterium]|jgi:glucokinase
MSINLLYPRLLGDVGGTNARFGWQSHQGAKLTHLHTLPCSDYPDIASAIESYLSLAGVSAPTAACIGIANPVTGDQITMTNHHWSFSIQALQKRFSLRTLKVINDFTALALALLTLPPAYRTQIGGESACEHASIALVGPGTGLGVSGLIPHSDHGWSAISGEGGHITLAAQTTLEYQVIDHIRQQYGHVSAERVLCGKGLVDLHLALSAIRQQPSAPDITPMDIVQRALTDHDADYLQTLDMFTAFLGSVAGDLALTLGARGGVYIGGGIVPRLMGWFETSCFRSRFEAKGRFTSYLQKIPVWAIQSPDSPALWGAANALDNA